MTAGPREGEARALGPATRGARTRERLLQAALDVLAASGPRGLTHRAVAEHAAVSLGTTTYHFASQREMLSEAFRLHLRRTRERAAPRATAAADRVDGADPRAAADALAGFLGGALREERASYVVSLELLLECSRDAELRDVARAELGAGDAVYAMWMEAAGVQLAAEDAALVCAVLQGLIIDGLARPDDPEQQRRTRRLLSRLLEALA